MRLDHNNYLYGLIFQQVHFSTKRYALSCIYMVRQAHHPLVEGQIKNLPINKINFGGDCEEVTPVPIPNTEVKLLRADGTAWATVWESRCRRI